MNKQIFKHVGVTGAEYRQWCKDNKKASYKPSVKADFFERIQDGRIMRDSDGVLVNKRRSSK